MKKYLALPAIALSSLLGSASHADINPIERLSCSSSDPKRAVHIEADFRMDGESEDTWSGHGNVQVSFGNQSKLKLSAEGIPFFRGAWTTDRLNFYLRDDQGRVNYGFIIEDYFAKAPANDLVGTFHGVEGSAVSTSLKCIRFTQGGSQ